jgi:hypothetical protein
MVSIRRISPQGADNRIPVLHNNLKGCYAADAAYAASTLRLSDERQSIANPFGTLWGGMGEAAVKPTARSRFQVPVRYRGRGGG